MKRKIDFDILESLRGLAALYVCVAHCRGVLWIGGSHYLNIHPKDTWSVMDYISMSLAMLTRLSTEFVIIFFVLSGFSIAHSLRHTRKPLDFYKRRFIRLYPPYVVAIFWAMAVAWGIRAIFPNFFDGTYQTPTYDRLLASNGLFNFKTLSLNLIYLPQMGGLLNPFWSLTHEIIFYILAPFLLLNNRIYYTGSLISFITINILFGVNVIGLHQYIAADFLFYNFFFAIGIILYRNHEFIFSSFRFLINYKSLLIIAIIFLIMVGISMTNNYNKNAQWALTFNAMLAAIMSSLLIFYLVNNNIRLKPLIKVGKFSYTIYITHFPSIFLYMALYYYFSKYSPPYIYSRIFFIPCIGFCLLIAYLQYRMVEKRTKYLLDKLRKNEISPTIPALPAQY